MGQVEKQVKHPAKYTKSIMEVIRDVVGDILNDSIDKEHWEVLDPMGGVGGIFDLHLEEMVGQDMFITSVEIEREWAEQGFLHELYDPNSDQIVVGDFFTFAAHPANTGRFDIGVTSWTYGNRMADHHEATDDSVRNTYRHKLGRPLTEGSSAMLQWGAKYQEFHANAYAAMYTLIEPGGFFIVNIKDHIRKGEKQPVTAWHRATAKRIGFNLIKEIKVPVKGNRQGENHEARVDHESVILMQRPFTQASSMGGTANYAQQSLMKEGRREYEGY